MPNATINVSHDLAAFQSEMLTVINPTNPLNIVGFSHRIIAPRTMDVYRSVDGAANWTTTQIDDADDSVAGWGIADNRFDPAIAFDANGICYILYGRSETNAGIDQTRLAAAHSGRQVSPLASSKP